MQSKTQVGSSEDQTFTKGEALALCLQRIAQHHRISVTPQSLVSGLPTTLDAFSPDLLVRSAKRAGIKARLQNVEISELPSNALPVIALLDGDKSVVVEQSMLMAVRSSMTLRVAPNLAQ